MRTRHRYTHWRLLVLVLILGLSSLGALVFRSRVEHFVVRQLICRMDGPSEHAMVDLLAESKDPLQFLNQLWATQKIPHRRFVADVLHGSISVSHLNMTGAGPMLLAAAHDADASVRELALATLAAARDPALGPAARDQLYDSDPEVRLLGLRYLRKESDPQTFPLLIDLLEDSDLRVVAGSANLLRKWTGIDYGIRLAQAISSPVPEVDRVNRETIRQGVDQWKKWWHEKNPNAVSASGPATGAGAAVKRSVLATADFSLANLDGTIVRLSEFRGKKVLINFWTTWCSTCEPDFTRLSELQRKYGDKLVVLGISLDGVPDEHGHGKRAIAESEIRAGHRDNSAGPSDNHLKEMLREFAQQHGIAYRVLHDPANEVGACFNGSELPTTILIDSRGRVSRRFVGARSTAVLETMLSELN